jgi:Zn-finger nucleic acid-binding protein
MRDIQVGDSAMLECERCRAVWVDAATFEHICASGESQAAVLHQFAPAARVDTQDAVRYRKCVACGTMMNRMNFGRLSGTIVDVCKGHGTWLDAGELHAIVRFIQGGGLDRARQRQIDDLKDQEQRARMAEAMRPRAGGPIEFRSETSWSTFDLQALLDQLKR